MVGPATGRTVAVVHEGSSRAISSRAVVRFLSRGVSGTPLHPSMRGVRRSAVDRNWHPSDHLLPIGTSQESPMPSVSEWKVPPAAQPKPEDYGYDLDAVLSAVVGVRASIPEDAFTADILGTERAGNGVVISPKGVVLTIGYLITEAETIWLTKAD